MKIHHGKNFFKSSKKVLQEPIAKHLLKENTKNKKIKTINVVLVYFLLTFRRWFPTGLADQNMFQAALKTEKYTKHVQTLLQKLTKKTQSLGLVRFSMLEILVF